MLNKLFYKHYVFLDEINDLIKTNLLKFKNISIIIDINQLDKKNSANQNFIIDFAKKNKIPFFLKNNFQNCIKYKANGIFIDSFNKKNVEMAELAGMSNEDIEKFVNESSVSIKSMLEQVYDDLLLNQIIAE